MNDPLTLYLLTIRGTLSSATLDAARKLGMLSHESYFRMAVPNSPEVLEFFAVDVWMNSEGMGDFYSDEDFPDGFNHLFTAEAAD